MRQVARDGLHEAYTKPESGGDISFTPAIDWAYDFFAGFPWKAERFEAVKALMFADPGFPALRAELAAKIGHDIFSDPEVARNE